MPKLTKEYLIREALKKYSEKQINNAFHCDIKVMNKDGKVGEIHLPLNNRGKKTKSEKIKSNIRSFLLNIVPDDSNKRYNWDTSSGNIESITIKLKYRIDEFKLQSMKKEKEMKNITDILKYENNNIITLIGENGAGKSRILEKVFSEYMDEEDTNLLAFSSGQNELFTDIFNLHKKTNKRLSREENSSIKNFYFNYEWSRVLVFLSATLKKGHVRKYLNQHGYIKDFDFYLNFQFRIKKSYLDKILYEYEQEAKGEFIEKLYRKTIFHRYLEKVVNHHYSLGQHNHEDEYDFLDEPKPIVKQYSHFSESTFIEAFGNNIEEIFTFLFHATNGVDKNIFLESTELIFKNDLEFKSLSDGEYQLLVVYAMLDLFDGEDTLFLFDEIDSHLHYSNINILWDRLKNIKGNILTTTHIPDSIMNNKIESIKFVDNGAINDDKTVKAVINRLDKISDRKIYEMRILRKIKNIILIDDDIDWEIFLKLVNRKLGIKAYKNISHLTCIKRESSYNDTNEVFGKSKLMFVSDFLKENKGENIDTLNIFLICDRDKLPLSEIKDGLQVNIHKDYKKIFKKSDVNIYLLSWRRLEIENYLLSKSLLKKSGEFNDYNFKELALDGKEDIATFDCKEMTHKIFKKPKYSESKLDKYIKSIPPEEISEDIEKMYNFIVSKI